MASESVGAASVVGEDKASQTLSQFVARVLNQLALSAWLPAAALVLALDLVFQLGSALAGPGPTSGVRNSPFAALGSAASQIGETTLGGAVVLVVAVVVLTVVTQAFTFEAIRALEGYWGTLPVVEWFAGIRRAHFAKKKQRLDDAYSALTSKAWDGARVVFTRRQVEIMARGLSAKQERRLAIYSPNVLALVEARVLHRDTPFKPTRKERETARSLDWRSVADPETLRRRINVDKKRCDFPDAGRTLPTRLGNILRAHEDATGQPDVETFIQRVFERLPSSLRLEHDEQRTRLDLYCSMVFVSILVTGVAVARLASFGAAWSLSAGITGLGVTFVMYGAAVATARAFGNVLVLAAAHIAEVSSEPVRDAVVVRGLPT